MGTPDLYALLGVTKRSTDLELRRAYRNLITKAHPDKGGDPEKFRAIQQAYVVLSDGAKRKLYDETGRIQKGVDEDFADSFAGGSFRDRGVGRDGDGLLGGESGGPGGAAMADQIIQHHKSTDARSHSAGFAAWLRSRGEVGASIFTADSVAEQYGVVASSYTAVPLAAADVHAVRCTGAGKPKDVLQLSMEALPPALEWGEVLVSIKYAPINPADFYSARLGGVYGGTDSTAEPPYPAGHDGVGVVSKVGPGVKGLSEGDVVLPLFPFAGTWRSAAVLKERQLLRVPSDLAMPLEYLALSREMCVAYRLLEAHGSLKPGDCIILNAANSTVGQCLLQLAALLRLRAIAVVRDHGNESFTRCVQWLKALGAAEVLRDTGSLKVELEALKFFAKPRLALDAVGGDSAVRLADCLSDGGEVVSYGCMSGKAAPWPWQAFVFKGLKVSGFNLRRWLSGGAAATASPPPDIAASGAAPSSSSSSAAVRSKMTSMLEALAKLVKANMLTLNYTEYDLATEFGEALDHALEAGGRNTKVLLRLAPLTPTVVYVSPVPAAAANADELSVEQS